MKISLIALFGAAGVLLRYGLGLWAPRLIQTGGLPVATFAINILGSFLIGFFLILAVERSFFSEDMRIALSTGFLGGFTTFSAFSLETILLMQEGKWGFAITYLILSPLLGISSAYLGMLSGRAL